MATDMDHTIKNLGPYNTYYITLTLSLIIPGTVVLSHHVYVNNHLTAKTSASSIRSSVSFFTLLKSCQTLLHFVLHWLQSVKLKLLKFGVLLKHDMKLYDPYLAY